jgi:hypothetical protein
VRAPPEAWGAAVVGAGVATVWWGTGATLSFIYYSF